MKVKNITLNELETLTGDKTPLVVNCINGVDLSEYPEIIELCSKLLQGVSK